MSENKTRRKFVGEVVASTAILANVPGLSGATPPSDREDLEDDLREDGWREVGNGLFKKSVYSDHNLESESDKINEVPGAKVKVVKLTKKENEDGEYLHKYKINTEKFPYLSKEKRKNMEKKRRQREKKLEKRNGKR